MKNFLNRNSLFAHIPLSLIMCFVLEWLSRHSFLGACSFVVDHTGAYLYNSFLIFVCYTLCYITKKQTFMRMVISAVKKVGGTRIFGNYTEKSAHITILPPLIYPEALFL